MEITQGECPQQRNVNNENPEPQKTKKTAIILIGMADLKSKQNNAGLISFHRLAPCWVHVIRSLYYCQQLK